MTLPVAAAALVVALALAGCGVSGSAGQQPAPAPSASSLSAQGSLAGSATALGALAQQLAGRTFLSTAVAGHELVSGSTIRIEFHGDGTIYAGTGCNSLSGAASWDDGVLTVANMGTTEMGCEQARMDQDRWFTNLLNVGVVVALTGNELTLTANGVILDLLDRRVADPDRPLVGTTWMLEGITSSDTATSCAAWSAVMLRIDGGEVNVYNGSTWLRAALSVPESDDLSVSSGTVHVNSGLAGERLDCTGEGKWFADLSVLGNDFNFTITAASLDISGIGSTAGLGLNFRAEMIPDPSPTGWPTASLIEPSAPSIESTLTSPGR